MLQSAEVVAAVNLSEQNSIIINLIPPSCSPTHMRRKRKNNCMAFSRIRPAWYLSVTHIRPTFTPTGMRAAGEAAGGSSVRLSGRSRKTHWDPCRGRLGLPLYQVPEAHTCMGDRSDHGQKHGDTRRRRRWPPGVVAVVVAVAIVTTARRV